MEDLKTPKYDEVIALLNKHAIGSAGVGLNLFP